MEPALDADPVVDRIQLDDSSWVDVVRGLVQGADEVHDHVADTTRWSPSRVYRYDHWVDEKRLGAGWRPGQPLPHPVLLDVHKWLQARYGVRFEGFGMARYRDAGDGQDFHRDRDMRWLDDTLIGLLTLGGQRPWLLRPRSARHDLEAWESGFKGATHDLSPASGDLLVMGGATQAGWEHSVPKLRGRRAADRISIQWRWTSKTGRPVVGASYRAPRHYSRG